MRINKGIFLSFCIGIFSVITPFTVSLSTSALSVDEIKDSPSKLAEVQDYKDAIYSCMEGGLPNFTYGNNVDTQKLCGGVSSACKASGFKDHNFFTGSSTDIYNSMLEKKHGTGTWASWITGDGSNGNLTCSENKSALFNEAMSSFGATDEQIKSLVCEGDYPGIYKITATSSDGNITSCSQSYDLLMQYLGNNESSPTYTIRVEPNSSPHAHFNTWFGKNFGTFGLSDQQKNAATYARASAAFNEFCADGSPSEQPFNSTDEVQVYDSFTSGGDPKQVYFKLKPGSKNKEIYLGVSTNGSNKYTCEGIAKNLLTEDNAKAYAAELAISGEQPVTSYNSSPDDSQSSGEEANCYNSGGVKSLGWIMCPIMEIMTDATKYLYENVVEPSLRVQPKLFASGNSPTHQAWSTFRDIANICFVVIILVVIFSQITGVGIDNYGIKKILPKLIIVAILVNLSYFLCQACVDVSNILGNFLRTMFNDIYTPSSGSSGIDLGSSTLAFVGIAIAMLGGIAVLSDTANVLALFVGLLGVIIGILFLFLLLAARQAAIIVLIVISPLAVICYALPNTKSISDKWIKFFEGLLMVYPIAGILVGGGDFVSRLLLSTGYAEDNFVTAFTAMIIGIVPIFFIPTVLRSAFSAMGNIGAKISGMGNQLGRMATSGVRGSQRYKDMSQRMHANSERRKLGMDRDGNLTAKGVRRENRRRNGFARLVGADRRHAARIADARKDLATGEEARAMLANSAASQGIAELASRNAEQIEQAKQNGDSGNAVEDYYRHQFREAAKKGDISGMNAALQAAESSGQMRPGQMADLLRSAVNHGELDNIGDEAQKAAWMRETAAKYGDGFMAKDYELKHYMQNAGKINGQSVQLGSYGEYAKQASQAGTMSAADLKPEDVTKMSTNSMAALAQAGVLSSSMAQQVKADNPNIGQDQAVLLGAIADGNIDYNADGANAEAIAKEAKNLANDSNADRQFITASRAKIDSYKQSTPTRVEVVNQGPQP